MENPSHITSRTLTDGEVKALALANTPVTVTEISRPPAIPPVAGEANEGGVSCSRLTTDADISNPESIAEIVTAIEPETEPATESTEQEAAEFSSDGLLVMVRGSIVRVEIDGPVTIQKTKIGTTRIIQIIRQTKAY